MIKRKINAFWQRQILLSGKVSFWPLLILIVIITGYEAGDCIGGFERGHMDNRQVVYAWVESHFGFNFVALAGGSSDMASHIVKEFPL